MMHDCKVLRALAEHVPDFVIEDVLDVFRVLAFVHQVPKLRGETDEQADPKTIGQLRERAQRIVNAMKKAGLIEERS